MEISPSIPKADGSKFAECGREFSRNTCVRLLSMIATNRDQGLMCREITFVASISMPVVAQQSNSEGTTLDKVKAKVAKLGTGEKAKATVILKDGTKIKGYIGQAGNDDFVLRDRKTDAPTTIRYSDVSKVESNKGHSTARNLGLGIGIGAGAFLGILLITIAHLD